MSDKLKSGTLKQYEVCEYVSECDREDCHGKNETRDNKFSCGLRRWLLIRDGFLVDYS